MTCYWKETWWLSLFQFTNLARLKFKAKKLFNIYTMAGQSQFQCIHSWHTQTHTTYASRGITIIKAKMRGKKKNFHHHILEPVSYLSSLVTPSTWLCYCEKQTKFHFAMNERWTMTSCCDITVQMLFYGPNHCFIYMVLLEQTGRGAQGPSHWLWVRVSFPEHKIHTQQCGWWISARGVEQWATHTRTWARSFTMKKTPQN